MKFIGILALVAAFSLGAQAFAAGYSRCRWSFEGTNKKFDDYKALYAVPPMMASASTCGPTADAKPVCVGMSYCESNLGYPPKILTLGCSAVKTNGKWGCPSAMDCYMDVDTTLDTLDTLPQRTQTNTDDGGADAQGEGVGGR